MTKLLQSNVFKVNGKDVTFSQAYITQAITHAAATKSTQDMLRELPQCDLSARHARDCKTWLCETNHRRIR